MNYEDLRKVQRLEKASAKLTEVEPNFFFELGNYMKDLESKADSMEAVKTLENVRKIARDTYERREQKVVVRALRAARTGDTDTEGMTEREKQLLSELVAVMKKYRENMFPEKFSLLSKTTNIDEQKQERKPERREEKGERGQEGSSLPSKKLDIDEQKQEKELLKVRVSKYIPQFITSHGKFGPYDEGTEISLPRDVCEVLVKKGYVEVLE